MDKSKLDNVYEFLIYNSIVNQMPVNINNFKFLFSFERELLNMTLYEKEIIVNHINNMNMYNKLEYITTNINIFKVLSKMDFKYMEFELLFSRIYIKNNEKHFVDIINYINADKILFGELKHQIIKYMLYNDEECFIENFSYLETVILRYGSGHYTTDMFYNEFKNSIYANGCIDKFESLLVTKKLSN